MTFFAICKDDITPLASNNKTCVQTLEGHAQNVSCVSFHPELPIIITGSEDGTVRIWHSSTYRLESTLNYGMERVWCVCGLRGSNNVALGYDEGSIIVKLGREEPAMSMDANGKIIWAKHSEVQQANLKAMGETEIKDGERLPLAVKDMGSCEIYPQTIQHNPNGSKCQFGLAQECLHNAQDYGGLLLLATSSGNTTMVNKLAEGADRDGKNNVAFLSYFLLGKLDTCLELLISTGRLPEAAFLARTYLPSQVSRVVKLWKENLSKINQKAADSLADPTEYENLFPGLREAFVGEQFLKQQGNVLRPASEYRHVTPNEERNVLAEAQGFVPSETAEEEEKERDVTPPPTAPEPIVPFSVPAPSPAPVEPVAKTTEEKAFLDLEEDLDNMDLEDIDTTDINLDDELSD
uniref:COPA/B TPR domain-containing protein n=1 Tax=Pyxicephalus adspersus TaxID=30357 RepID=A0AAV3ASY4_PYXAD|nr:TPA: hypothetical protein GDO54_010233 [Pyxicephalus adspersus]